MSHDHDHGPNGHEHLHEEPEFEVQEMDEETVQRLLAEGKIVPMQGPDGEMLYMDADAFDEGVRMDLAQHADDAPYLIGVGGLLLDGDHNELAQTAAGLALATAPASPEAQLFAGIVAARRGRMDESLTLIDRHLELAPSSSLGHTNRANVLLALGRTEEARAAARRALALDPNDVSSIQVLVAGDDGPAAALDRTKQLAAEVKGWGVLRVAGDLAATLGDDTTAVAYWKQSMALGADDATIANLLAQLGQAGRIDELVSIADELPRLSDRDPGLRWNVASGYEAAGREAEARIVFASIAHDAGAAPDVRAAAQAKLDEA
jgi:tetratricopeptide (TPR) repeat protein